MRLLAMVRGFCRSLFHSSHIDRELDDELRGYVEERTERYVQRGMSPAQARRAALVEIGGMQQVKEQTREVRVGFWMETLWRDVAYGARMLRRAPVFAAIVIATLGLVIGANATVFSVMHAVLWRPLPYPDADLLVIVDAEARGLASAGLSDGESLALRTQPGLFTHLAHIVAVDAHVSVDGEMEHVPAASATDDALRALGAEPMALGRPLHGLRDGGMESTIRAIVISHALWQRRLKGDPNVIGRHIEVNNIDAEIVGVLRPDFRVYLPAIGLLPDVVDVWFPRGFTNDFRNRGQISVGRLAPDISLEQAQAQLDIVSERLMQDRAADYSDGPLRLYLRPLHDMLTADVKPALWVLAGAVGLVLLIGCVNVANLMLARARTRLQEMAVRRALGAGQARLVRQLLTEAALLSMLGAAAGFALAHWGVALVEWLRPAHLPRQSTISVTGEVAAFTAIVAVVVSIAFGLLPALSHRVAPSESLRAGRSTSHRPGIRRLQRAMVVAEVALSIVPLVAAGLMLRTFVNLTRVDVGFDAQNVLTGKVAYSLREYRDLPSRWQLHAAALDRVRQLRGVDDVAAGGPLPLDDWQSTREYGRIGDARLTGRATIQSVMPGYLRVTRTLLVAGREFTEDDIVNERPVVIVDQQVAEQLWPDRPAIGQQLLMRRTPKNIALEVIGVIRPVRVTRVRDGGLPHLIIPFHLAGIEQALVIRTRESAATLGPAVKQAVESLGTRRPFYDIKPMRSYIDASLGDTRFMMLVLTGFGLASILLAAIGLYGTLAYLTSLRTQEFGIRLALGASAGQVLRSVAGEGLVLAAIGAAIGFAGAMGVTGTLRGLLYNVTPFDGVTLTGAVIVVALTALVAASHPAWRAARTNPMRVLREAE